MVAHFKEVLSFSQRPLRSGASIFTFWFSVTKFILFFGSELSCLPFGRVVPLSICHPSPITSEKVRSSHSFCVKSSLFFGSKLRFLPRSHVVPLSICNPTPITSEKVGCFHGFCVKSTMFFGSKFSFLPRGRVVTPLQLLPIK